MVYYNMALPTIVIVLSRLLFSDVSCSLRTVVVTFILLTPNNYELPAGLKKKTIYLHLFTCR